MDEHLMGVYPGSALDPIVFEVGRDLIALIDPERGELPKRAQSVRGKIVSELGFVMPPVSFRDNLHLSPTSYRISIKGVPAASGSVSPSRFFAFGPPQCFADLDGEKGKDPSFGMEGIWIERGQQEKARDAGCLVFDLPAILSTHLAEVVKDYAHDLLGLQETQVLVDGLAAHFPIARDLVPAKISLHLLKRILKNLLREKVSIIHLGAILESVAEGLEETREQSALTEYVRTALGRQICDTFVSPEGNLPILLLEEGLEFALAGSLRSGQGFFVFHLPPSCLHDLAGTFQMRAQELARAGCPAVLVTIPMLRFPLRSFCERQGVPMAVIKFTEIPSTVQCRVQDLLSVPAVPVQDNLPEEARWAVGALRQWVQVS